MEKHVGCRCSFAAKLRKLEGCGKRHPEINLFIILEANRLTNGNTAICNWCPNGLKNPADWPASVQVIEVAPDKNIVWALRSSDEPADLGPASAIQLLDEPVLAEQGDLQR